MVVENHSGEVLREGVENLLKGVLQDNGDLINNIDQVRMVAAWYKEAKNSPEVIPSIIINDALNQLLGLVVTQLEGYLVDTITAKIRIDSDEIVAEDFGIAFSQNLYVEYVKKVDSIEFGSVKFTFDIKISGKLKNIRISRKENRHVVNVDKFIALVTISIVKVQVVLTGVPSVSFASPIQLCRNKLMEVRDLSFNSRFRRGPV